MKAPAIRISIGKFDADKAAIVEEKLRESRALLESGIRAMTGNSLTTSELTTRTTLCTMLVYGRASLTRTKCRRLLRCSHLDKNLLAWVCASTGRS